MSDCREFWPEFWRHVWEEREVWDWQEIQVARLALPAVCNPAYGNRGRKRYGYCRFPHQSFKVSVPTKDRVCGLACCPNSSDSELDRSSVVSSPHPRSTSDKPEVDDAARVTLSEMAACCGDSNVNIHLFDDLFEKIAKGETIEEFCQTSENQTASCVSGQTEGGVVTSKSSSEVSLVLAASSLSDDQQEFVQMHEAEELGYDVICKAELEAEMEAALNLSNVHAEDGPASEEKESNISPAVAACKYYHVSHSHVMWVMCLMCVILAYAIYALCTYLVQQNRSKIEPETDPDCLPRSWFGVPVALSPDSLYNMDFY